VKEGTMMKRRAKMEEKSKNVQFLDFSPRKHEKMTKKRWKMMKKGQRKRLKCMKIQKKSTTLDFSSGEYGKMSKTVKIDEKGSNNVDKSQNR
jgi:hypothetical protein